MDLPKGIVLLLGLWILAEILSIALPVAGGGLSLFRLIRSKLRGTRWIRTPDSLIAAIGTGALRAGDELQVAEAPEWEGSGIHRFAIPPGRVPYPAGTRLLLVTIGRQALEIRPLAGSGPPVGTGSG